MSFYSLQLDDAAQEGRYPASPLQDLAPELTDWAATAAAMMELDLIITVDTSVAHLAGALGRPVWILLSAVPEWRWMLERRETPWYGSARLYRQSKCGDWSDVFAAVAKDLTALVDAQSSSLASHTAGTATAERHNAAAAKASA